MSGFFLRPVDLGALVLLFVGVLVLWRLLRLRPLTSSARFLALFLAAVVAIAALWLGAGTRLDQWSFYALQSWGVLWAIGMLGLVQHVYRLGELDPEGREARKALIASLLGLGLAAIWAIYQIRQQATQGQPTLFILPIDLINLAGFSWALIVVVRQGYRNWRSIRAWVVISHLFPLFLGVLILVAAGVVSVAAQVSGFLPLFTDFGRVFVVGVAANLIGFSFLSIAIRLTSM